MRKEYKQMMDQLSPREELVEQVLAQAGAHAEQKQNRRRPMHKKKLILALAAALVVLTGSAMAVGSQLGLLNVFFQGDTSGLEPYVQTDLGSAENEDFRFTVNSAYYDGMTVYATVTWEGSYESYTVAYAEAASEEWTEATAKGNSYTIEGLKPETAYRLRLRSFNSETDFSQWSEEKVFTTTALPECVTPTDLAVAMPTATTATLSWTAGERNLSWTVNWRKSDASAWTAIEGLTATSCELTGLTEGAAYIWRVMAECELNESRWSSQNRFTAIPTAIGSTDITGVTAFVKDGTLNIVNPERGLIRSVRIYNAAGQLVAASSLETTDNVFMPLPACDGNVLIIKIDGEGCQRTIKTAI